MDQPSLEAALADLKLPAIHYFSTIDSTNVEASRWLDSSAPDLALVVADEQTAGRGRAGRRWVTTPGTGVAFSMILLSPPLHQEHIPHLTGLGAVAVRNALQKGFDLKAQIKWPNDVLLAGSKVAGVLAETRWRGEAFQAAIIGIGINIAPESVDAANLPVEQLDYPATCIETEAGHPVGRHELIHAIIDELFTWLPKLSLPVFISEWESALAYRNQWVELSYAGSGSSAASKQVGRVIGLTQDGSLRLLTPSGRQVVEAIGDIHLRPTQPVSPRSS